MSLILYLHLRKSPKLVSEPSFIVKPSSQLFINSLLLFVFVQLGTVRTSLSPHLMHVCLVQEMCMYDIIAA